MNLFLNKKLANEEMDEPEDITLEYNSVLESLMEDMPIGCYILKPDHTVLYWNREVERLLGYLVSEMQGERCTDMPVGCCFTDGKRIPFHSCPATIAYTTGRSSSLSMFMRHKDGKDLLVKNTFVPIKDMSGQVIELVSLFVPMTEESYNEDLIGMIYEVVTRDPLTCLPSRKYMEVYLQQAFDLYHRSGHPFAVLFVDVNHFTKINHNYGQSTGDTILHNIGLALCEYGRKTDRFCRWSGDEFVGLLEIKGKEDLIGAMQ